MIDQNIRESVILTLLILKGTNIFKAISQKFTDVFNSYLSLLENFEIW